jgi:hypothetical protein
MAGIADMATTYNLPNYAGELMLVTPDDTPFLTAIGGLASQDSDLVVTSTDFTWQTEDLAAAAQPSIVEGDDPDFEERSRANISNVVQIFQYGLKVSYSKLAAYSQLASLGNGQVNPVQAELDHQVQLKLKTAARDVNYSFIRGAYNKPSDNTTARRTRGLLAAIATNVTAAGAAALTEDMVMDMLQAVYDTRGIRQDMEPTLIVNSTQKRKLSTIFITNKNYQEATRNVGGVNLQTIETDFGRLNIMLERAMPQDAVAFAHVRMCRPRFLLIPDKGFLFVEPVAKTGAYEAYQLYGEVGLEYGDEGSHGKITGLATA